MRIAIGADHAGFPLKEELKPFLAELGHDVLDVGTRSTDPVDYPAFCAAAARAVVAGEADRAIVLGGSGQGEQIAANKVIGARAALCHDERMAELARRHNDANVLSMGGRIITPDRAEAVLHTFLTTGFDGGRHARRVAEIAEIEQTEHS
jgi:ribose 5-phosphate isomerase B